MTTSSASVPRARVRHLGRGYMFGLGAIAALGIGASTFMYRHAEQARSATLRSSLTGRQRMLTQRLATAAFQAVQAQGMLEGEPATQLRNAATEWSHGFDVLRHGSPAVGLPRASSADSIALNAMRADRALLDDLRLHILSAPNRAATADSVSRVATTLIAQLDGYLHALDVIHQRHVQNTQRIAIGFCLLLLTLLGLEAAFVFRPAIRAIGDLIDDQEVVKQELYAKAEEMYDVSVQREIQNEALEDQRRQLLDAQDELLAQQTALIAQRDDLESRTDQLTRLTAILEATPDAVAVFSLTGDLLYANAAAERHLSTMRRRNWTHAAHLLTPDSVRKLRDTAFPRAIRRGLWQGEVELRTSAGPVRTMVQTLLAHRSADRHVSTIAVLWHDITELKLMQAQLSESDARNRSIVEALAEGVVVQDAQGRIMLWNAGAERILGLTGDQLTGRTSLDPSWRACDRHGATLPGDQHPISRARSEGISIDGEVMGVYRGDGKMAWLSVNARPMPNSGAAGVAAAVATFTDITSSLTAARELETLSVVARQTDHGIVMINRAGRITWVNTAWETLSGYVLAEVEGRNPAELLHGTHTRPEAIAAIEAAHAAGRRWSGEILHYRRDGTPYWVELNASPTSDASGTVTGFIGLIRDITARRNADRERQQLAAAVAVTADGIAIAGVSGALEFVNHAFARMHGHRVNALIQSQWSSLYQPEESRRLVREAIPEATQVGFWQGEATGQRADGSLYPQELSLTLLPHGGLVAVARDISERKTIEEQLKRISVRDELTSLYNRRGFLERADATLRLAARQGTPCALFYGDLDSFKAVNDGFGHTAGDAALTAVSGILTTTFRETDLVARIGGDEFTILAIDVQPDDISVIIDRIEAAVAVSNAERRDDDTQAWHLGISLGVAYFNPAAPEDVESLLRTADALQYEQKRHRKSQRSQAA